MKIIQLTDLHIDTEGEFPFDIDVRKNFQRILHELKAINPDHLVITGDLCCRAGDPEIYTWIKIALNKSGIPYSVISGNHDDSTILAEVFELEHILTEEELFYAKKIGKNTFLFLDSAKGFHSDKQRNWLKRQLKNATDELVVFTHHPPVIAGVPFMDNKHALQDIAKMQKILFSYSKNIHIFCGHYHVARTIRLKNLLIQITPSLFFQIDALNTDFKVDHHRIAYRLIEINNDQLTSSLKYFRGSKK